MKNKKIMIAIISILCVLLVVSIILIVVIKKKKQEDELNAFKNQIYNIGNNIENIANDIKNENKIESVNNTVNNIVSNTINNNTVNNNTVNEPVKKTPNQIFKEKLSDEDWVKNNLYMKKDCFGKNISVDTRQFPRFVKVNEEGFNTPIVIVYTECAANSSNQCYVLTYNDGEVEVKVLNESSNHLSHTQYDLNIRKKELYKSTKYTESETYEIYNITDKGLAISHTLKMKIQTVNSQQIKYYYDNNKEISAQEYNNIKEEHSIQTARKDDFIIISKKNLEEKFK